MYTDTMVHSLLRHTVYWGTSTAEAYISDDVDMMFFLVILLFLMNLSTIKHWFVFSNCCFLIQIHADVKLGHVEFIEWCATVNDSTFFTLSYTNRQLNKLFNEV